jgi:tape measure domain-containing protein
MATDVSMAVSVTDKTTQPLTNMRQGFAGLSKSADDARAKLENFQKMQHTLEHDVDTAAKAMREARKEYAKTGDEISKTNFEKASAQYDNLKLNLKRVSQSSKDAEKDLLSLDTANSKVQNRASGSGGIMAALGKAGAWQYLGQVGGEIAQTYMTSRYGSNGGTMTANVLSGAGSGAAIGTMINPGVGTAIGAVAGAAVGAVQGIVQNSEKKDDAYKSYVQDQYTNILQKQSDTMTNGSTIAGGREQTQMAFAQRFGSDSEARAYLEKVKTMAATTNYTYDEITGYTKKLLNTYDKNSVFGVLMSLSDATAGLNLSSSDVDVMISGLSRMRTTGKATMEYLNYFSERGVDVYQALANATGKDKSAISDMVTKGKISGNTAAQAILDYINQTFGGLSDKLSTTYNAMVDNLKDAQDNVDAAMGRGYNDARKSGIQAQTDFLNGDSGGKVETAYQQIGAFKAEQDNAKEKLERDALNSLMYGHVASGYKGKGTEDELQQLVTKYSNAQKKLQQLQEKGKGDSTAAQQAASTMNEAMAAAQVLAYNEYMSSDGAKIVNQSNLDLIGSIQNTSTGAYEQAGYTIGQALTKGIQSALSSAHFTVSTGSVTVTGQSTSGTNVPQTNGYTSTQLDRGGVSARTHANGLAFVPYNGYPAVLHYGERVLTANQARQADGSGSGVVVTGNNFTVRSDADIEAVAREIAKQVVLAKTLSKGGGV